MLMKSLQIILGEIGSVSVFFFEFVGGIRFVESLAKKKGEKTLAYRVLSSDSGSKRSISLLKERLGETFAVI